ncbi:MAG: hypothetical protein Q8O41_07420 [Candidatus Methanoperedens sp.]|nr:hypothetical protein [Candidatus Methanoperedens sp.]
MEFAERVRKNLEGKLNRDEGNCGTCHKVLREITNQGGKAMCLERPDGIASFIYDNNGNIAGRGEGITWPPAVLFAQAEGGFLPKDIENEILKSLECIIDMEKVAEVYGYGRVVTPVAAAYTEVWKAGGKVGIKRSAWGITVTFYDKDGKEICTGPISYCPTCGTAAALPRAPELAEKIKEQLRDKRNTGKQKFERKLENWFYYKNDRVLCEIKENGKTIGRAARCCLAYAGVVAEVHAGIAGAKWGALFKEYCKACPVKLCRQGKNTGHVGNLLITDLEKNNITTEVGMNTYITAMIKKNEKLLGKGIGTVCAFSSMIYAAAKSIELRLEIEVVKED